MTFCTGSETMVQNAAFRSGRLTHTGIRQRSLASFGAAPRENRCCVIVRSVWPFEQAAGIVGSGGVLSATSWTDFGLRYAFLAGPLGDPRTPPALADEAEDAHTIGHRSVRSARVEVLTGVERRRSWTVEQKRAIVGESLGPDLTPTEVARKYRISTGQLYTWRQQLMSFQGAMVTRAPPRFAPVELPPSVPAPDRTPVDRRGGERAFETHPSGGEAIEIGRLDGGAFRASRRLVAPGTIMWPR